MPRIVIILTVAVLVTPLVATADTINGCVKQNNGKLRIVGVPGQCKANETPISWESEGPAGPQGPPGEATCGVSSFQLVGFTAATVSRGNGVFALTATCQSEFPGSRICDGVEVLRTVDFPDLSSAGSTQVWIRPKYVGGATQIQQASGLTQNGDCLHYTDSGGATDGSTVDTDGMFQLIKCDQSLSVACCAPVP